MAELEQWEKYKLLGTSDTTLSSTGYGHHCRDLFKRLARKPHFDCKFIGWQYQGLPFEYDGYTILPNGNKNFAEGTIVGYVNEHKPDILYFEADSFMLYYTQNIDFSPAKTIFNFMSDGVPLPVGADKVLKHMNYCVAPTKFAQQQVLDLYGIQSTYIPYGVDTSLFRFTDDGRRKHLKQKWSQKLGMNFEDKFVVGLMGRMQGRKMHSEAMKAFSVFAEGKKDVALMMHMDLEDPANPGYMVQDLVGRLGLTGKVFDSRMRIYKGYSDAEVAELVALQDVQLSSTSGEGVGMMTLESMASGVPSIVTDFTTTKELLTDTGAGIAVPLYGADYNDWRLTGTITGTYNVERGVVDKKKMVEALQFLYDNPSERKKMGKNGKAAVDKEYNWDGMTGVGQKWNDFILQAMQS